LQDYPTNWFSRAKQGKICTAAVNGRILTDTNSLRLQYKQSIQPSETWYLFSNYIDRPKNQEYLEVESCKKNDG
jgi:hypothetical protein